MQQRSKSSVWRLMFLGLLMTAPLACGGGEEDKTTGTATYTVGSDGVLTGTWTTDGSTGQGQETLTPAVPPINLVGPYSVAGTNPSGSTYTGDAEISFSNGIYTIHWTIGNGSQVGECTLNGDTFSCTWQSE